MNALYNTNKCLTCSSWWQHYPENKLLGDCKRLPVMLHNNIVSIIPASDWSAEPDPTRDIDLLRTTFDFGCISYTPK